MLEILTGALDCLITGELQQASKAQQRSSGGHDDDDVASSEDDAKLFGMGDSSGHLAERYLQKTYNKTGSLMALSCKGTAVLACKCAGLGAKEAKEVTAAAFRFGRDLGLCFQLVDDAIDFEAEAAQVGKPTAADLK